MSILFHEYEVVAESGLFDSDYYVRTNVDIQTLNVDPLIHYLEKGCREGRNPSADFDAKHYLTQCLMLGETPTNPVLHYLSVGMTRGLTLRPTTSVDAQPKPSRRRLLQKGEAIQSRSEYSLGGLYAFGYLNICEGWLFSGWVRLQHEVSDLGVIEMCIQFEHSEIRATGTLAFCTTSPNAKVSKFVAFTKSSLEVVGHLKYISFAIGREQYRVYAGDGTSCLMDEHLLDHLRPTLLHHVEQSQSRDHLMATAFRPKFTGQDTLSALSLPVLLEIDEALLCPPNGVLLKGWVIFAQGAIRGIRLRCGELVSDGIISNSIRVSRPDVIAAVRRQIELDDDRCGFVSFVANATSSGDEPYLEVELNNGEIGFKKIKVVDRPGLGTIRRLLEEVQVNRTEIDFAFDRVIGPAVASLNAARLKNEAQVDEFVLGASLSRPTCSVIIPLYGRIDFMEYQMAFFSRHGGMRSVEFIYVLDDPAKRGEFECLARATYERFRIPFRCLVLGANVGFGPASNAGLSIARGQFVCFLNSDVFPISDDWLDVLIQRLRANAKIGIIGPRLLFEDGSVQHEGCFYRKLAEYGNWIFLDHINKGRRPGQAGLIYCDAITGACMVLKRSLALKLQGFDDAYVIGDFEDSDLCLRIRALDLACAVDTDACLYHLERKSQSPPSLRWRMNLTLYNAWVHQRKWFGPSAICA